MTDWKSTESAPVVVDADAPGLSLPDLAAAKTQAMLETAITVLTRDYLTGEDSSMQPPPKKERP